VIDDHTRLAYCEIHAAETAITVSATLRRAARWFCEQGCGPVQAVMSDNAKCYARSHAFRDTLAELGARHNPDPALHAALERQDRALLAHPGQRMGAQSRLAHHRAGRVALFRSTARASVPTKPRPGRRAPTHRSHGMKRLRLRDAVAGAHQ
jgi:hypothetical protein